MFMILSKGEAGQQSQSRRSPIEHRGTFALLYVCLRPKKDGLRPKKASLRPGRAGFRPERADRMSERLERPDLRLERPD